MRVLVIMGSAVVQQTFRFFQTFPVVLLRVGALAQSSKERSSCISPLRYRLTSTVEGCPSGSKTCPPAELSTKTPRPTSAQSNVFVGPPLKGRFSVSRGDFEGTMWRKQNVNKAKWLNASMHNFTQAFQRQVPSPRRMPKDNYEGAKMIQNDDPSTESLQIIS